MKTRSWLTSEDHDLAQALDDFLRPRLVQAPAPGVIAGWILQFLADRWAAGEGKEEEEEEEEKEEE